jgi:hypothetical protein
MHREEPVRIAPPRVPRARLIPDDLQRKGDAMAHAAAQPKPASGITVLGLLVLVLVVAGLYMGGEWFVHQQAKTALGERLRHDVNPRITVGAVALEGTLFHPRRAGEAVVILGPEMVLPLAFVLIGYPIADATITIDGYDRLEPLLRQLLAAP